MASAHLALVPSEAPRRLRAMDDVLEFTVHGQPQPGGSKTAFPLPNRRWHKSQPSVMRWLHDGGGRPIINVVDANGKKLGPWKQAVTEAATLAMDGRPLMDTPLLVEMSFYLHRYKTHYGTGANSRLLRAAARLFPDSSPDVLKLARPVEDAMTGIVYTDDGRTVDLILRKRYVEGYCIEGMDGPRVEVRVAEHTASTPAERAVEAQGSLLAS